MEAAMPEARSGGLPAGWAAAGLKPHQVFWNEQGAIVCAECHIPFPGSDTWIWECWREITPETVMEIIGLGGDVACEGCGKRPLRPGEPVDGRGTR
jgi:hypothetical protein